MTNLPDCRVRVRLKIIRPSLRRSHIFSLLYVRLSQKTTSPALLASVCVCYLDWPNTPNASLPHIQAPASANSCLSETVHARRNGGPSRGRQAGEVAVVLRSKDTSTRSAACVRTDWHTRALVLLETMETALPHHDDAAL